jgi:formylglycine-generating enzyme required for sulfatase activity
MGLSKHPLPPGASLAPFPNGDADEAPAHQVDVSPFMIGATEVTNRQ